MQSDAGNHKISVEKPVYFPYLFGLPARFCERVYLMFESKYRTEEGGGEKEEELD